MNNKNNTIKIEQTENGYILTTWTWKDTDEQGNKLFEEHKEVFEEIDSDKETLKRMLEKIAEWTGYEYDKFGNENINIKFDKKGYKYVPDDNWKPNDVIK